MQATVSIHGMELPGRIVEASKGIVRVQFLFDEETHNKVMELFDRSWRRKPAVGAANGSQPGWLPGMA